MPSSSHSWSRASSNGSVEAHATGNNNGAEAKGDISIYGQELNYTTWRLARMNLAIRGIAGRIEQPVGYCVAPGGWNHVYP